MESAEAAGARASLTRVSSVSGVSLNTPRASRECELKIPPRMVDDMVLKKAISSILGRTSAS